MNAKLEQQLSALIGLIGGDPTKDAFTVRINWRQAHASMPHTFLTLKDVTSTQLAQPEAWLAPLLGGKGGVFDFEVFHANDVRKKVGDGFQVTLNLDRAPSMPPTIVWAALKEEQYVGPRVVQYPPPPPDAPISLNTADAAAAPGTPAAPRPAGADLTAQREDLQRRETALAIAQSEARILAQMQSLKPAPVAPVVAPPPPPPDNTMPLLMKLFEQMDANRRDDARRFETLLTKMSEKPAADPLVTTLLEKALNSDTNNLNATAAAMAQMTQSMVQVLHTKAEIDQMNQPAQEAPLVTLLSKGIDAWVALNGGGTLDGAEEEAPPDEPAGELEAGAPAAAPPAPPQSPTARLEALLRAMRPADEVAEAFCVAIQDAEFQALRKQHPSWEGFIQARLGAWAAKDFAKRSKYLLDTLVGKAFPLARERGLMPPLKRPAPAKKPVPPATPAPRKRATVKRPAAAAPAAEAEEPEDAELVDERPKEAPPAEPVAAA